MSYFILDSIYSVTPFVVIYPNPYEYFLRNIIGNHIRDGILFGVFWLIFLFYCSQFSWISMSSVASPSILCCFLEWFGFNLIFFHFLPINGLGVSLLHTHTVWLCFTRIHMMLFNWQSHTSQLLAYFLNGMLVGWVPSVAECS